MHECFHPATLRDRRLENHRARGVGLESAHRNLALRDGYGVAAGVETIDSKRAQAAQDAARGSIYDLLGLQFCHRRGVSLEQRGTRRKNERNPEPSLARTDDPTTGQTPYHVDSAALGRSVE